ncbi:MAG: hypothetical protein KDB53_08935, partial [Planctomycetes bacterium]|nr:hypothetical protein [Planctomycetota bacterium]
MRQRVSFLACILALSAIGNLWGQAPGAHWTVTPTVADPPLRRENPGTSDGTYMYVFGGQTTSSGPLNDLWRFDGVTWTQMTADGAAGSPPARFVAAITWDFANNLLIVFGGQDASGAALGDTWAWDPTSNTWADVTPSGASPSPRKWSAMAFDWFNQQVLLFGGLDASGHLNDTWHFDGMSWTQLSPAGAIPAVRRQHALVERFDFVDVIMCGGQEAGGAGIYADTWKWDGLAWSQIMTTNSPAGRVAIDAAY